MNLPIPIDISGVRTLHISNDSIKKVLQSYVQKVEGKKATKAKSSASTEGVLPKSDSVTITARSSELKKAKEAYDKLPEVREEVVAELKAKVESGDYKVNSQDMADRIVHRTIVDKLV